MASTNTCRRKTVFIIFAFFVICPSLAIHALAASKKDYPEELKTGGLPSAGCCSDSKTSTSRDCKIDVGSLRGGDIDGIDDNSVSLINRFLETPATRSDEKFYIQGWRWHVVSFGSFCTILHESHHQQDLTRETSLLKFNQFLNMRTDVSHERLEALGTSRELFVSKQL